MFSKLKKKPEAQPTGNNITLAATLETKNKNNVHFCGELNAFLDFFRSRKGSKWLKRGKALL